MSAHQFQRKPTTASATGLSLPQGRKFIIIYSLAFLIGLVDYCCVNTAEHLPHLELAPMRSQDWLKSLNLVKCLWSYQHKQKSLKEKKRKEIWRLPLCSANGPLTEIYLFGERNPNGSSLDPLRKCFPHAEQDSFPHSKVTFQTFQMVRMKRLD